MCAWLAFSTTSSSFWRLTCPRERSTGPQWLLARQRSATRRVFESIDARLHGRACEIGNNVASAIAHRNAGIGRILAVRDESARIVVQATVVARRTRKRVHPRGCNLGVDATAAR